MLLGKRPHVGAPLERNQHRDNEGAGGPCASGSLGTCVDKQIYRLCVGFRAGMHADRQAVGGWGAVYPSPHIDPAVKTSTNHTETKPSTNDNATQRTYHGFARPRLVLRCEIPKHGSNSSVSGCRPLIAEPQRRAPTCPHGGDGRDLA